MPCGIALEALASFDICRETLDGARVETHCRYPSFEPVFVYVVRVGEGFRVHDAAGAYNAAWMHGRDDHLINRALNLEADRHVIKVHQRALSIDVQTSDWLRSAILVIANASANVANLVVAKHIQSTERQLFDSIKNILNSSIGPSRFYTEHEVAGRSGGLRRFDFAIPVGDEDSIYINAVSPHHSSISSKYVAFADVEGEQTNKLAVYERTLDTDDVALLQQVSSIVPLRALEVKPLASNLRAWAKLGL